MLDRLGPIYTQHLNLIFAAAKYNLRNGTVEINGTETLNVNGS